MPADTRYTSAKSRRTFTFDAELEFKDAGLVAADAAATVDSSAKVVNLGTGLWKGQMVIDITAIETDSSNESYLIAVQLSNSSSFSSGIVYGAALKVGHSSTLVGGDTTSTVGRYVLPFTNEGVDGACYQYCRLYTDVTGTIATGINYQAFAVQDLP